MELKGIIKLSGLAGSPSAAFLSDHSRAALSVSYEEVGSTRRTIDGTLRGFVIARKASFSTSWQLLPSDNAGVVDYRGGSPVVLGAKQLKDVYLNNRMNVFSLTVYSGALSTTAIGVSDTIGETYAVRFKECSFSIEKRNAYMSGTWPNSMVIGDFWNVSVGFEEV